MHGAVLANFKDIRTLMGICGYSSTVRSYSTSTPARHVESERARKKEKKKRTKREKKEGKERYGITALELIYLLILPF